MNPSKNKVQLKAATQALKTIIRESFQIGAYEARKSINHVKDEIIIKKITKANQWYMKVLGLDEINFQQQRVMEMQTRLLAVQDKRREVVNQLDTIQKRSGEIQVELLLAKKEGDNQKLINLLKEEVEVLKMELEVSNRFDNYDREEREIFWAFTNEVKISYEKQRAQLEYTKYFQIILGILGSLLLFCYSTYRKRDVNNYVERKISETKALVSAKAAEEHKAERHVVIRGLQYLGSYFWKT